jgi:hypothetical protein
MDITANPDAESLKLIVWLLISVLVIMLSIVGYLLTFGIGAVKTNLAKLAESFMNMTNAITELKVTVAELKTQINSENPVVSKRLDTHSFILTKHEGRIKVLETEHNFIHKRNCGKEESDDNAN